MTSAPGAVGFADTVTVPGRQCPACGGNGGRVFYEVEGVPANQVRLMPSREQALDCEKGDLRLAFCPDCGFIWNATFRPERVSYTDGYESTQTFSPTFNRFHEGLARQLFDRYDLADKQVFEIGCGQGEFLQLLAKLGAKHATGFDPALRRTGTAGSVTLIGEWYSEAYADLRPDFIATKMVMEHIPDPARFLSMIRRTIGDRPEVVVFAMIPDAKRILEKRAFWDIYYEHCAYFTLGSLARAFRSARFDVLDLHTDFGDQYCLIAARPGTGGGKPWPQEEAAHSLAKRVDEFAHDVVRRQESWRGWLRGEKSGGRSTALWGGGSKGVAFLSTLRIGDEIGAVVDINARKGDTYMPGSGHRIRTPEFLRSYRPDNLLIMSPIYLDEIRAKLASLGLAPRVLSIEDAPNRTPLAAAFRHGSVSPG